MPQFEDLKKIGQSLWYDNIRRGIFSEIEAMIKAGEISGMTSNPAIFDKAISGSNDYDKAIAELRDKSVEEIYDQLTKEDIQKAADLLKPVYDKSNGLDGYISIEVSPLLAHNTEETVSEAQKLVNSINRKNLMIKVPATEAGFPAITELIAQGINVNATLIFSLEEYEKTAQAYLEGLKRCTKPLEVASVASFFVSRTDSAVDKLLPEDSSLRGKVAVSYSKMVYQKFREIFESKDHPQRLLFASTGTKNPDYSDLLYVEELIGEGTVNTVPPQTLTAFRDHGKAEVTVMKDIDGAIKVLNQLNDTGIDLNKILKELKKAGVTSFIKSFEHLINTIKEKKESL